MMSGLFEAITPLFAQDGGSPPSTWTTFLLFLPLPLLFYFMIYRPQKDQETKRRAMLDALKKNDDVVTAGGVHGTVVSIDDAKGLVVLRIDDDKGVKMKFDRASVVRILGDG